MNTKRVPLLISVIVIIAALSGCGQIVFPEGESSEQPAIENTSATEMNPPDESEPVVISESPAVFTSGSYQGVPAGFTEDGYPYLGDPDASVTLEEYSDFLCPFCGRHFQETWPALFDQYVKNGLVKYVFRDLPLEGLHPTAPVGHAAALCVAEQGAEYFWQMHDQLFLTQNQWSQTPDPTPYLQGVAESTGVDMLAYQECMAGGRTVNQVAEGVADGYALGFNGTPSFQFVQNESGETYTLIGAYPIDTFTQWLDALLAGEAPPQEEQAEQEPAELPFWANAEGLAPDPDRPGFTLAGDPYKGDPKASLVVVEFSDFQCPACAQHALEIQPVIDETFVETDEILWVFKNLPLQAHPYAPAAAVAAECAAEQGSFWEMHHLLYEQQEQWTSEDDADAALLDLAQELDLDMTDFSACFNSRQALERVLNDIYDAQGVINSTPNFVILYAGRGRLMESSLPVEQFITSLQNNLIEANAGELESSQP